MNPATITIVVYLVGISAIVSQPGKKIAIFPVALNGTYKKVPLMPHTTYLHLRGSDFVDARGTDPEHYCRVTVGGQWDRHSEICSLELRGAKLWTQTSEPLSEDPTFKKAPAFQSFCTEPISPKRVYTEGTDPNFVAARLEMTGGVLSGCNRKYGAFVTKLTTASADGVLVIERPPNTLRIPLADRAAISIENRADPSGPTHATTVHAAKCNDHGYQHFGWYYFMASGDISCDVQCPIEAPGLDRCKNIPGVPEPGIGLPSASGPDCGNTTYP